MFWDVLLVIKLVLTLIIIHFKSRFKIVFRHNVSLLNVEEIKGQLKSLFFDTFDVFINTFLCIE